MPRKKKVDTVENTIEEVKKADNITVSENSKTQKSTTKKTVSNKKTVKDSKVPATSESEKKVKTTTKSVAAKKSNSKTAKDNTKDKEVAKKTTSKKLAKSNSSTKKAKSTATKTATKTAAKSTKRATSSTTKTRKRTVKTKVSPVIDIVEYYDLPYRYNQTVIKVLYQTPDILFIYWDISDEDRLNFANTYGNDFFDNTKPVLIIHNNTMNYSFEVEINDFANSWYLHINDTSCEYSVELGRRPKNFDNKNEEEIKKDYFFITYSNKVESPNDHILFDKNLTTVYFKDVKTNITTKQDITSLSFIRNIGKIYNLSNIDIDIKAENIDQLMYLNLKNPSSGNPTSTFR